MNVFAEFQSRIAGLIEKRIAAGELPLDLDLGRFVVEPPRDAAHGDLSTNAAMVYAREAKRPAPTRARSRKGSSPISGLSRMCRAPKPQAPASSISC